MNDEEWTDADDAVEEVWEARRRIWERCDNDPKKYVAYMREFHIRLVRAGWKEVPPPAPREGQFTGVAEENQTTGDSSVNAAEKVREGRPTHLERLIDSPRKLLAFVQEIQDQLVREGWIKPDSRSRGQGKSAA